MSRPVKDPRTRFMAKVEVVQREGREHWIWRSETETFRPGGSANIVSASRFSWTLYHGAIPDGACILRCAELGCVAPSCLSLGTRAETARKGNANYGNANYVRPVGEKSPNAKLTSAQVLEIRELFDRGVQAKKLAPLFGVSVPLIYAIKDGRAWAHLPLGKSANFDCRGGRRAP